MAATQPDDTPVRLVCFDLGGVLVRIARDWTDACRRADVDPTTVGGDTWANHHALMLRYETGQLDEAGYAREVPACVPGLRTDDILRVFDAWLLGMYDGADQLLRDLRARGLATACLSNTNARHWRTLTERPDLYRPLADLDHQFVSYEIGVMKPDPAAYRHVETATGRSGGEVLFFDDRPENIAAARAVGWRAEQVDRVDDAVTQIREHLHHHGVLP